MTNGTSSRHRGRNRTKGARTGVASRTKSAHGTDWDKLRRLSDSEIRAAIKSDPDAHATDEQFWKKAKLVYPPQKSIVTIRLDNDVLAWFRQQRGYQTRVNAFLYGGAGSTGVMHRLADASILSLTSGESHEHTQRIP